MKATRQRSLVLASSSPRRQELIRSLRLPFEVIVSHADESYAEDLGPAQIVETLSLRKASSVAEAEEMRSRDAVIIGSDTIVVLDGQVLGKPVNPGDAARMLRLLQGRTHEVYSGVACLDGLSGKRIVSHRITQVKMKALTKQQIIRYIATGEPQDKAGSYAIQGLGATLVESIEGCYFNVVGLPLSLLSDMLSELGIDIV